jgi:hypothetical protein
VHVDHSAADCSEEEVKNDGDGAEPEPHPVATSSEVHTKDNIAPYLYTVNFNHDETLLMAGGAGRNEFKIFDWKTGKVMCNINNIPKAIICGAVAKNSNRFVFGATDARMRMFDICAKADIEHQK